MTVRISRAIKSYEELIRIPTFEERFQYLQLRGSVGSETFGHERWMNQAFYTSTQWRNVRQFVIARDEARDLAFPGYEIGDKILIHHIIPMTPDDIEDGNPLILDPNNLITTSHNTHNAIHYGDRSLNPPSFVERRPGDTKSW